MYRENEREFREQNQITDGQWEVAAIDWNILRSIGDHYESQKPTLARAAEALARDLQAIDRVHSVRFRVKDTDHLLAKIIRKRAEGSEKYMNISAENYQEKITDLVGVRALHLFKEDLFQIDRSIRDSWALEELPPVAFVREGDQEEMLSNAGFEVKPHVAGYRSVHYIVSTRPMRQKIIAELQVRTIFEEGWSEIDHTVKYPNYSDDESIAEFLGIFNRLAGAADEMGSFVRRMARSVQEIRTALDRKDEAIKYVTDYITASGDHGAEKMGTLPASIAILDSPYTSPYRRNKAERYDAFRISDPKDKTTGDFVSFKIIDGNHELPGRISRSALAVLGSLHNEDDLVTFENHKERIRKAAFNIRRMNPLLDLIALGSSDFAAK
ncbi:RelA/SpoT domain-containing protein [Burkholderia multivorans]|uniref:RelA/SpoT domain-containing protein n=1 Tax=Burkholderia multivorans TaxID=87883 RepID=UPI000757F615|nr:hypothetical protein [Burkholderia multivorans]KVQ76940.1 hypothetical protein WK07_18585 [Burkholderia multivorans]